MESMFLVSDVDDPKKRTFYRDELLPPLPLPRLEDTLTKYLDSCRPVLDSDEFRRTSSIVQDFLKKEGQRLQEQLEKRSRDQRNWLDTWWLDGYLTYRGPAAMINFSGLSCHSYWPLNDQLKSAALEFHFFIKFWKILREERLKPQTDSKGNPFNMSQFRSMFNTCRIPQPKKDEIRFSFKTKYEGNCPSHIVVLYKKRIYKINGVCPSTGQVLTPSQFHKSLLEIVKKKDEGDGVAFLTELKRDEWANARLHLNKLSLKNQAALNSIETAIFCAAIPEDEVMNKDDLLRLGMFESSGLRWMDKMNLICARNNDFIVNMDHTPMEGMVMVTMIMLIDIYLRGLRNVGIEALWGDDSGPVIKPIELTFHLDNKLKKAILQGHAVAKAVSDNSEARYFNFTKFGKDGIKKLGKIHPCAFIQVALQYAYMKIEGRPASTYETATTRMFYKGRTETLRTCTSETVTFCRAMMSGGSNCKQLFMEACQKYYNLMEDCLRHSPYSNMFFVVEMSDTVRIHPWLFNVNQEDSISVELNKKLANKVFYNVGLCICLFDIIDIKDSYIFPGDGATHTKVTFRYVVFRPFIDEVMVGKIKSCSRDGVTITMGFFDDITVPPANMQQPSKFDESEQLWIWEYETEDGEHEKMFMDVGEEIRFRVAAEHFVDTTPSSSLPGNQASAPETSNEDAKAKIPYSIEATVADSGLGLLSWWG